MKILGIEREIIINKKNIKNLNIRVKPDLKIYVNAPSKMTYNQIYESVNKHKDWIERSFKRQLERQKFDSIVLLKGKPIEQNLNEREIKNLLEKNVNYLDAIVKEVLVKLNLGDVIIKYRFMKSRWGSCMYKKRIITLNKYLIHFDENIVKSVLCHEICHLYVPNHSKDFYSLLVRLNPYYKKHRDYLKKHSHVLK